MQVPNEQKRRHITSAAARMFAARPFHKVRLDDIAAAAGVGKGTLYVYFDSKEDLYFTLTYEGFAQLVDRLNAQLDGEAEGIGSQPAVSAVERKPGARSQELAARNGFAHPRRLSSTAVRPACVAGCSAIMRLERIVYELVAYAYQHPHLYELMRTLGAARVRSKGAWESKCRQLTQLIERTIRAGVAAGELCDARPELTAQCIPGMVRSLMLSGPRGIDEKTAGEQIVKLLTRGLAVDRPAARKAAS
ncbi:MAG: putative Transcriptional regulator, TetR family [Phycisphaerales bacterium]|jgi:AcrR family transcriptional regulator|nr:putative Transcriptional regulator, TetR family [Phycisphaerales bacterium]MDB5356914.1 putative Transcriptional regulator, TetR family [Phycisphaerales bacterium]